MPSAGGGTTTVQKNEPPKYLQPFHQGIAQQGWGLLKQGVGPSPYPGSTYAPLNLQGISGLKQMQQLAAQGNPLMGGLMNTARQNITNNGLSAQQQRALDPLNRIANSQFGRGNADFSSAIDTALGKARDTMMTGWGGMGRDDPGGAMTSQMATELGNAATSAYANQYNQDRDAALAASGQIHGVLGQGQQNAQGWASMAPQIRNMQFDDPMKMMQVGQAYQQNTQNQINQNINRWNQVQNRPWNQLQLFNNLIGGLGGGYGTQTTNQPYGSPWSGIFGAGLTGLGALGGLLGGGV